MGSKFKIVVLQRGWVFVGRYKHLKNGTGKLENASCIRYWGTSKGLGELLEGPLSQTKLDKSGTVRFNDMTVVAMLDVKDAAWEKHCA